jgi:hypothetical protein
MDDDEDPSGNNNEISPEFLNFLTEIISRDVNKEL